MCVGIDLSSSFWIVRTWRCHVRDMTRSCGTHDSFMCETWRMHTSDMTHSYRRHDSFIREAWLTHTGGMTHSLVWDTWLVHVADMTHSYGRRDSFICVTWLIHAGDMTRSCGTHDSFMWETRLMHTVDTTHSYGRHDAFICVTWIVYAGGMRHPLMKRFRHAQHQVGVSCVMLNINWVSRLCHAQHQLGVTIVSCSTSTWCQCHAQHQLQRAELHVVTHAFQPAVFRVLVCWVGVHVLWGGWGQSQETRVSQARRAVTRGGEGVGLKRLGYLEELWLIPVRHVTSRTHLCMVVEAL